MLKHYLKVAFRNCRKHKIFSFLNIAGLAIGMAGAMLLLLWIHNQLSIDQFHKRKNNIYKAYNKTIVDGQIDCSPFTPALLAESLQKDFPEIKEVTRSIETGKLLRFSDKKIKINGSFIDPAFLNIFSFPLVKGNSQTALKDRYSIIITEKIAKIFFGKDDPMNKIIRSDNSDNFIVTGVIKDLPHNTQFKFDCLFPWEYLKTKGIENAPWVNNNVTTFVELQPAANIGFVNNKISDVALRHSKNEQQATVFLYPLTKLWLQSHFENGKPAGGGIDVVRILAIMAGVILLIACINFMNLSTARSEKRAKEVGIKKMIGAARKSLIWQFLGESIFLSLIAGIIALCLVELVLPAFNTLTEKHLAIAYTSVYFWLSFMCFLLLTGILAGSYPAFYLSSFKPIRVLKGIFTTGNGLITPRKVLVVFQFSFAIVLINFTFLLQKQTNHLQNRETGFIKENLLFHPITDDLRKNFTALNTDLINSGAVISVSKSNTPVTNVSMQTKGLTWTGKNMNDKVSFELLTTQKYFIETTGIRLIAGRDIDIARFPTDTASCLLNETAVKLIGFINPLGQIIKDSITNWKIVGVVKDFITSSPFQSVNPIMISGSNDGDYINIRLNNNQSSLNNIKIVESIFKKYNTNFLTEFQFADEAYANKIKGLRLSATLINIFAAIAIFISCLGLFGLVTYTAENKTKEIGIRKVLGASIVTITSLLAKDFIKLVVLSIIIASPLAWLLMSAFLRPFYYRINLSGWILVEAGTAALLITFITISSQSIKAARENPAKCLRTD